jgi:hypothetical protein
MNPGVRFIRSIDTQLAVFCPSQTSGAHIPGGFGFASREKAHKIAQVSTTDQQTTAVGWVANQLGNPAYGLLLYGGAYWSAKPRSNVGIDCSRQ